MSRRDPEVLIVGAGPAGSALAGLLAKRGRDVLLLDRARFPREKACGECLSPGGVEAARRLGLLDAVLATEPVPLEGWSFTTPEGHEAGGSFGPGEIAFGVRRGAFDHALLREALYRGARVREGWRATEVAVNGARPEVRVVPTGTAGSGEVLRPRLLVGADGLRSVVARAGGVRARPPRRIKASLSWRLEGPPARSARGRLFLGGPFTAGLAPVRRTDEAASWSLSVVLDPAAHGDLIRGPSERVLVQALARLLGDSPDGPLPAHFSPRGRPRGSGPFDRPAPWVTRGPILLVGDAAGYFDPLTGQGIYRALRSAELAAPLVDAALASPPTSQPPGWAGSMLAPYERHIEGEFASGRTLQRALDVLLDRPRLRGAAVALLETRPDRVRDFIRITGDVAPLRSLLRPGFWLPGTGRHRGAAANREDPFPVHHLRRSNAHRR